MNIKLKKTKLGAPSKAKRYTHTCTHTHICCFCLFKKFRCYFILKNNLTMPMACGILLPRPGMEPTPPALAAWGINSWITREVQ